MHPPVRSHARRLGAVLVLLSACRPDDTPTSTEPISVRVEQDVSRPLIAARGESIVLDVWTEHEGGAPAQGAVLQWALYGDGKAPVQQEQVEQGHTRLTIGPLYENTLIDLTSRVCPDGDYDHCDGGAIGSFKSVRVTTYGGVGGQRLAHGGLDLTVGERRPIRLTAVAGLNPSSPLSVLSSREVSMTSSDDRILRVDGLVLEGLEPGAVTLELRGAGIAEQVTVTVHDSDERPLRRLDNESVLLEGGPELGTNARMITARGAQFDSIVFDEDDNPVVLARVTAPTALVFTLAEHVDTVLARWTGTGWGAEAPFEDWMSVYFPVMVIDEANRVYVGAMDKNRGAFVVAVRELDDLGGPFTYHYLPVPALLQENGYFPEQRYLAIGRRGGLDQQSVSPLSDWISLYPKAGGGVHFAITPSYESVDCTRVLIVGTLDPDGTITSREEEEATWPKDAAGFCDWVGPGGVPTGEVHWEPPAVRGGQPKLLPEERTYWDTPSPSWLGRKLDGLPAPGTLLARDDYSFGDGEFRFDDGDRTFVWHGRQVAFRVVDPFGAAYSDSAAEALFGTALSHVLNSTETWVGAIGQHDRTVAAVHEGVVGAVPLVTVVTSPPAPPVEGSELSTDGLPGRRIGARAAPAPVTSLVITPDGHRVALVARLGFQSAAFAWPGVLASEGVDQPWVDAQDRVFEGFDPQLPLRIQGSTLYTLTYNTGGLTSADLHRSVDHGASWTTEGVFRSIAGRTPLALHLFPNDARLVASGSGTGSQRRLYLQWRGDTDTGWPNEEWFAPAGTTWNQLDVAPLAAADGTLALAAIAVTLPVVGAPQSYRLVLRLYDADGAYTETREVPVSPGLRLHTGVSLPSGELLFFGGQYGEVHEVVTYVARVDPDALMATEVTLSEAQYVRHAPLVLGDGTLVVGGEQIVSAGAPGGPAFLATYRTSVDGLSWSAPTALRPAGGRAQVVYADALEPDGAHVLFVVGDSGTLWSDRSWAVGYADAGLANALTPPMVPMSVRVGF